MEVEVDGRATRCLRRSRPLGIALLLVVASIPPAARAQNIVLVIGDDMGVDTVEAYAEQPLAGPTPNIDSIAREGVLFRNAWAYPVCSPFRASVFTGLHPHRHGVGHGIDPNDPRKQRGLDPGLPNLARLLGQAGYRTAALGKWHLAGQPAFSESHPLLAGFDLQAGFLWGGVDYFDWPKTVNGVTERSASYITTDIADDAIEQLAGSEPFFLWVAFTAPHAPYHEPPQLLHSYDLAGIPIERNQRTFHKAMLEAMDTELGRILAAVDWSDTTVFFVGDNGTKNIATEAPFDRTHGKGTVYEGGLNVPLLVAGQAVPAASRGGESQALVQAPDLFASVLEVAGVDGSTPDSVSIAPYLADPATPTRRRWVYSELFLPHGGPIEPADHQRAARNARYKLLRRGLLPDELYDLQEDPFEQSPLALDALTVEEWTAYVQLAEVIASGGLEVASGCADGRDNDGDGSTDFPADPDCRDPLGAEIAACRDGLDNDGDGGVDWAGAGERLPDPDCASPDDASEAACGVGAELVLPLVLLLQRRRRAPAGS